MRITLCAAIVGLLCAPAAPAQIRAFTGATVIDGNGGPPIANATLLVEGRTIKAIGPASRVAVPSGAERINVSGKYIVPGLMDANVHLVPWPSWTYIEFL